MVRVQDDLFAAVNEKWLKTAEIPEDRASIAAFTELVIENETRLDSDFEGFLKNEPQNDALLREAVRFYKKAGDWKTRNNFDKTGLKAELEKVENLSTFKDFKDNLLNLILHSQTRLPFVLDITPDMMDALHYALVLTGPGLILPDTSYYDEAQPRKKALLDFWQKNTSEIFKKLGYSELEASEIADKALKFDELLVPYSNTSEEWAKYPELYRPVDYQKFTSSIKNIEMSSLIPALVNKKVEKILAYEERFYLNFDKIVNEENFEIMKAWMLAGVARAATKYLSDELRILGTAFSRFLSNVAEPRSQKKYQLDLTEGYFDQVIGMYYGKKYFGEKAKSDVKRMVEVMISVYKERLDKNTWLSRSTIDQAIDKLESLKAFVGYPDKLPAIYKKFIVGKGNLYEDALRFNELLTAREYEKFSEEVDKTEWAMPAQMVNAYYSPDSNSIFFPAAILQAPFYSLEEQTTSANFGGIGAVIAHEISHAFDNNGAQFDKFGNLHKWWTDEDYQAFEEKQTAMVAEFDGVETEAGKANGRLIVSENIADNGGIACALAAAQKESDYDPKAFFKQWAMVWRMKASLEYQQMLLSMDVHAPALLRANIPPTNLPEFYTAFDVKKGDGMYRALEKRVNIW